MSKSGNFLLTLPTHLLRSHWISIFPHSWYYIFIQHDAVKVLAAAMTGWSEVVTIEMKRSKMTMFVNFDKHDILLTDQKENLTGHIWREVIRYPVWGLCIPALWPASTHGPLGPSSSPRGPSGSSHGRILPSRDAFQNANNWIKRRLWFLSQNTDTLTICVSRPINWTCFNK